MKLFIFTLFVLTIFGSTSFAEGSAANEGQMSFSSSAPPAEWPAKDNFSTDTRKATLDLIDSVLPERATAADATKKGAN